VLVAHDNTYDTIMEIFDKNILCIKENDKGLKIVIHQDYKKKSL